QSKIIDNLQSQIKWLCHKFFKGYKSNGKATIFDDLFVEYKELNNENHTQYTIGKYGIKEMKDDHVAYSTNSHIVFLPCSLILGIGIDEIGVSKDLVGCCSPIYKTYKINTNILLPSFFNFYANFYFNEVKRFITQKSTRREFEFDYKALHKICFNIPSIETQGEHAKLLETFMQKLQKEKDILSLYKKQKAYLLKNLFI
ncbi:MAG: hypothetical protein IJ690_01490, partial [Clostridia bacterium]|nr:hypothetical protein [Clostridia bacterium]